MLTRTTQGSHGNYRHVYVHIVGHRCCFHENGNLNRRFTTQTPSLYMGTQSSGTSRLELRRVWPTPKTAVKLFRRKTIASTKLYFLTSPRLFETRKTGMKVSDSVDVKADGKNVTVYSRKLMKIKPLKQFKIK